MPEKKMATSGLNKVELEGYDTYFDPWIGWRTWDIVLSNDQVRLQSITFNRTLWSPGEELIAKCLSYAWGSPVYKHAHTTPSKEHGCGIYGVKEREDAIIWMDSTHNNKRRTCIGEVKLWGIVFRFTEGFLAQNAYPKSIYVKQDTPEDFPLDARETVHELRRVYRGVEVRLL